MRYFEHSEEIVNAEDINIQVDSEKLNRIEQLGLYLLGDISLGRLAELWNIHVEDAMNCMGDLQNSFKEVFEKYSIVS